MTLLLYVPNAHTTDQLLATERDKSAVEQAARDRDIRIAELAHRLADSDRHARQARRVSRWGGSQIGGQMRVQSNIK